MKLIDKVFEEIKKDEQEFKCSIISGRCPMDFGASRFKEYEQCPEYGNYKTARRYTEKCEECWNREVTEDANI